MTSATEGLPPDTTFQSDAFDMEIRFYQYENLILNGNTLELSNTQDNVVCHVVMVSDTLDFGDGGTIDPLNDTNGQTGHGTDGDGGAGGGSGGDGGDAGDTGGHVVLLARQIKGKNATVDVDGANGQNGANAGTGSSGSGAAGNDGFSGIHLHSRSPIGDFLGGGNEGGGDAGGGGGAGSAGARGGNTGTGVAGNIPARSYTSQNGAPQTSAWSMAHYGSQGGGGGGGAGSTGTLSQAGAGGGGGSGGAYASANDQGQSAAGQGGAAGSVSGNDEEGYGGGGGGGGGTGGTCIVVTNFLNIDLASDLTINIRGGDGGDGGDGATNGSGGGGGGGATGGFFAGFGFSSSDVTVNAGGGLGGAGGAGAGNGSAGSAGEDGDDGVTMFVDTYPVWVENLGGVPSLRRDKIENRPAATEVPEGTGWIAQDVNRIYAVISNSWVIKGEENDDGGTAGSAIASSQGVRAVGEAENVGGDADEALETDKTTRGESSADTQAETLLGEKYDDHAREYKFVRHGDTNTYEKGDLVKIERKGITGVEIVDIETDPEAGTVTLIAGERSPGIGERQAETEKRLSEEERA